MDDLNTSYTPEQFSGLNLEAKLRAVAAASKEKLATLQVQKEEAIKAEAFDMGNTDRNKDSWLNVAGAPAGSLLGDAANLVASGFSGIGRGIGHVGSLVANKVASDMENDTPDAVLNAYNRFNKGKETAADVALLKAKPPQAGYFDPQTNMERLFSIENTRRTGRKVNDLFDFNPIVEQTNREGFNTSLDAAKKDVATLTNSEASVWDRTKALGGALSVAGSAAASNKMAVAEYITENLPQLVVGGMGTKGAAILAGSNLGYAMDEYSKGMENRAKEGKGVPLSDERDGMMLRAASLAAAEQAGDMLQLGVGKLFASAGRKAASSGLKGGFIGAMKETSLGFLGEAATEGYQTHQEQVIEGRKVNDMETFKGAVIGGLSGAAMIGGIHTLAGLSGDTPEKAAKQTAKIAETQAFQAAVEANDPAPFLDTTNAMYNPALAVGVLHQANLATTSTPDSRDANFDKATELLTSMDERQTELKDTIKNGTPTEMKEATGALNKLNLQIRDGQAVWNSMFDEMQKTSTPSTVQEQIQQANTSVKLATPEVVEQLNAATDSVINLSMASISHLTPEQAADLSTNMENGLSDEQRSFLRLFSAARIAYNEAQTVGSVSNAVMNGDAKNIGISQYRTRIGMALTSDNKDKAASDLALLNTFATSHTEKAVVAQAASDKYGDAGQVFKSGNGWGIAAPGTYTAKELKENGGLVMVKPKLLKALKAEAKAVAAVRDEMNQAVSLKFDTNVKATPSKAVSAPVQSVSTPAEKTPASPASLFREKREREGRVEEEDSSSTEKTPKNSPTVVKETTVKVDSSTTPVVPSPQSVPLTPVADAPEVQDTSSAALTEPTPTPDIEVDESQQEVAEQPAVASAKATVAEATTAVEAIAEKAPTDSTYKQKKLGDFFIQSKAMLGRVKDVISLVSTPEELAEQAGISDLSMAQGIALRSFLGLAKAWQSAITVNLVNRGKPEYNYEDAMQYFIRPNGDIEENVKTAIAYAVYSYVAENFGGKGYNTMGAMNAIMGREKSVFVNEEERTFFADVTASLPAVVEALGQRVTKALGLQTTEATPVNELVRLQAGLGAHALRLLTDGVDPLMTMRYATPELMAGIASRSKNDGPVIASGPTSAAEQAVFMIINRDAERKPIKVGEDIVKSVQGAAGIINELFTIENAERPPTFQPVKKLREFTKRTDQVVPEFLKKILQKLNNQKNFLRLDKLQISQVLGDERFLTAMGVTKVDDTVQVANRESAEARNDGLRRELNNIKEFVTSYLKDDLTQPFFFEHYAMKQQRVGIANSLVNPQGSKLHRFMVYRNSWITTVDMANREQMENFVLRVGEGMGIDPAKMDRATALAKFKKEYQSEKVQAGIAALTKIHNGETLTDSEKDAIVVAVNGHAAHGLDALVALSEYDRAVKAKKSSFKVNMLSEVDGVTNGPMLSHLLMGAAESVEDLFSMLNRGGFYRSEGAQFNDWRSTAGNQDLYETTTKHTLDMLSSLINSQDIDEKALKPVMYFIGQLTDPVTGAVLKAGRNMIKTPLTAMVYGSGIGTAIEGMAGDFISNIYKQMETAYALLDSDPAKSAKMHKWTVAALIAMGIKVPANTSVSEIMDLQFSKADENMLIGQFMNTLGKAVDKTIRADFKHLLDSRQRFNATASLTFDMYNAAYEGLRNQLIEELVKSGEIEASTTGVPLHDLTPKQEEILYERMEKITPVLQTAMSNLDARVGADTGMLVSGSDTVPAKTIAYKNVVNFGTGFKQFSNKAATKSLTVYARRKINADPGVGLGATSTHSFDSAVAHTAIMEASNDNKEILNLHDAGGTGIDDLVEQGRRMNKAVWDRAISWSPTTEMYESFMRTVRGMEALIADKNTPKEVLQLLAKSVVAQSKKYAGFDMEGNKRKQPAPATMLMARALEAKRLAAETNRIKFGGMAEMYSITQYAVEGGQYDVTDENRAEALNRLAKETTEMLPQDIASVQAVNDVLKDYIEEVTMEIKDTKVVKTSDIGTLGKPAVDSDIKLVNHFRRKPKQTVQEVAALLKKQNLTGYQDKLLSALVKSLGERATAYSVNFLTKTSELKDVLEPANGPSHAWFVSKNGTNAIYLLSPDFTESGLTVETLLHEMTHAAVAHAIANPTVETQPLIDELEKLKEKAAQVIYEGKMTKFAPAIASVQELVAYGMTNPEFQAILDSFAFTTTNEGNKWVSGLKAFIDTLVKLVFGKNHDGLSSGFTTLTLNVSGLMAASAKSKASTTNINQSMAAPNLASLSGEEMFDALATLGTTQLSPEFDIQLRFVMNLMEESVHSPLAAMKAAALANAAQTPVEMWDKMKTQGLAEFAKGALSSGFHFTEQEVFAQQQVEATVRTALSNNDGSTSAVYRELARLYAEVRNELKGRIAEFHPNGNQAQKLYDFVFKMEPGMGNMSDYLSRFAALGLTNHEFANLLGFRTTVTNAPLSGMSFSEKLHAIFERVLEFINAKATNTFGGQKADQKLMALVNQLVDIEQRKRMKLSQSAGVAVDTFEKIFRDGYEAARKGVNGIATSNFIKTNTYGVVRFAGAITSMVANDRLEIYMNNLQTFRDATMRERQGILMGLVNEVRGAHTMNTMYHKLLRITKHTEGTRKAIITNTATFVMESFKDEGKNLKEAGKRALSYGILRTDMAALLGPFDIKGIQALFASPTALNAAITQFENKLAGMTQMQSYLNGAKALGLYLATNEAGAENLRLNADNIAAMFGTEFANKLTPAEVIAAAAVIDPLASLYAIRYLDGQYKMDVNTIFTEEASRTDGGHGIEMLIKMHKDLQEQSKDRLFQSSGALRMKGYTPEIYNPYIRVEVANVKTVDITTGLTEGEQLEQHGYEAGALLEMDVADPTYNNDTRIYSLRDGGMVQYLTGIFSYTGMNKRGSSTHNGDLGLLSQNGLMNRAKMDKIARDQKAAIKHQGTYNIDPKDNAKSGANYLVPVFNAVGDVVNYRYMMNAATKDALLERTNDFDQLMGVMAGSIYDKEITATQNATAVQALYDQYKQDFGQNTGSYLQVGPNSPDAEAREVWRLLPESTKESVRTIFGTNAMMVRYDVLDMNFGYRKRTAATAFGIPEDQRDAFQKVYVELLEGLIGKKAGLYVRRLEDGWQALVAEAKDTLVVKSGMTLLGNFTSNVSALIWFGVPLTDIWHHHRVALKGVTAYRKDTKKLDALEIAVRLNSLNGRDRNEVNREITQLKDALARNPVRELVEAGMMPTIVEDVAQDEDKYSYKGQLVGSIDDFVGNLNPHVLKAGKVLAMAHDTPLYKALAYGTQVSDFVARYTLHQHLKIRSKNPLTGEKALQMVSDAFVNYDVPSHRDVQYANDMGLVYFTKYCLRIQKVIALLYRENPGRAMMLLTLGHFMDFLPMLTHSQLLERVGNPFSTGAFEALTSLDEMLTVQTLMTPFR